MTVQMELSRILIRELNDYQLIELREIDGERSFPIVIGLPEAQAIERRLKGIEVKRPLTHELIASLIDALGGKIRSVTINDLSEHTFFATIDIEIANGEMLHVDSRPSDAIALAVRYGVQIYVATSVMDEAAFVPDEEEEEQQQGSPPQQQQKPKQQQPPVKVTRYELLHQQLKEAIEKENYEKAAALRDEIRKLEQRG